MTNTAFFTNRGADISGKFALKRNVSLREMGNLGEVPEKRGTVSIINT